LTIRPIKTTYKINRVNRVMTLTMDMTEINAPTTRRLRIVLPKKMPDLRSDGSIASHCKKMTTEYKMIQVKQIKLIQPRHENSGIGIGTDERLEKHAHKK